MTAIPFIKRNINLTPIAFEHGQTICDDLSITLSAAVRIALKEYAAKIAAKKNKQEQHTA
jgi:hypothetical protein